MFDNIQGKDFLPQIFSIVSNLTFFWQGGGGSGEGIVDCFIDFINLSLSYQKNVNIYHWLNDIQCLKEYNIHFALSFRLDSVILPMNV